MFIFLKKEGKSMNAIALATFFSMVLVTSPALCMKDGGTGGAGDGSTPGAGSTSLSPSVAPGFKPKPAKRRCCSRRCQQFTLFLLALTGLGVSLHQNGNLDGVIAKLPNMMGTGEVARGEHRTSGAKEENADAEQDGDDNRDGDETGCHHHPLTLEEAQQLEAARRVAEYRKLAEALGNKTATECGPNERAVWLAGEELGEGAGEDDEDAEGYAVQE